MHTRVINGKLVTTYETCVKNGGGGSGKTCLEYYTGRLLVSLIFMFV